MNLQEFFTRHPRAALAFSGGADSSYLLWAGLQWAEKLGVYYVKSPFQPEFEYRDALRLAKELGAEVTVIAADPLCDPKVAANPADRCYYCKKVIMAGVKEAAKRDGFDLIIDGTNASDDISDRPGFKALGEEGVLSPLRMCGITKARLRELSREAGLFTWNKPAYACLATRVYTGEEITAEKLRQVEGAEETLRKLGYSDFRVRLWHGAARLQLPGKQLERAASERRAIREALAPWFSTVLLDLEER